MLSFTEKDLRTSFINASLRERKNLALPPNFAGIAWDKCDYLGWRDPKVPNVGYVVVELDGAPVGILLRQSDGRMHSRPQCSWCEDVQLPNDVVLYNVKRAGQAGRDGNTVGTLACANFECSANVRKRPALAYVGFDVEAARQHRIDALRRRVSIFVRDVRDGA